MKAQKFFALATLTFALMQNTPYALAQDMDASVSARDSGSDAVRYKDDDAGVEAPDAVAAAAPVADTAPEMILVPSTPMEVPAPPIAQEEPAPYTPQEALVTQSNTMIPFGGVTPQLKLCPGAKVLVTDTPFEDPDLGLIVPVVVLKNSCPRTAAIKGKKLKTKSRAASHGEEGMAVLRSLRLINPST